MKNSMNDLRDHLFAALEALGDPDKPMEIERAKAIAHVAQTAINAAKVQVDYMEVTGKHVAERFFEPQGIPDRPRLVSGDKDK